MTHLQKIKVQALRLSAQMLFGTIMKQAWIELASLKSVVFQNEEF